MFRISFTLSEYAGKKPMPGLTEPTLQLQVYIHERPQCRVHGTGCMQGVRWKQQETTGDRKHKALGDRLLAWGTSMTVPATLAAETPGLLVQVHFWTVDIWIFTGKLQLSDPVQLYKRQCLKLNIMRAEASCETCDLSSNRPTWPIRSSSREIRLLSPFHVLDFEAYFAPTSWSRMSKIFRD